MTAITGIGLMILSLFGLAPSSGPAPGRLDFFFSPGCRECDEARAYIEETAARVGIPLEIVERDINERANLELLWAWEEKTGKNSEEPTSLVVGGHFLNGESEIYSGFENLLLSGAYLDSAEAPSFGGEGVRDRFGGFAPTAVLGAWLLDGINPCAFTVLVMLLSLLAVTGSSRTRVLQAGLAFTAGVFLAYLLVGLGLAGILVQGERYRLAADIVYLVIGGAALVLGIISIRDGLVTRATGDSSASRLKLPASLLRRIQRVLATGLKPTRLVFSAVGCGLVVSLLELVCTGQVYLPTIALILREPDLRSSAFFYLVLYCLAFILPLLAVFGLVYFGSGVAGISRLGVRYSWVVKLATGLLFLGLGLFLILRF